MEPSNVRKKLRKPPNVIKVQSHVMLVLHNMRIKLSNVRKKIRELLNVTKVLSNVMLVLPNLTMKPSNVGKNKGVTTCDKRIVTYDVGTTQYDDGIVKCEEKK